MFVVAGESLFDLISMPMANGEIHLNAKAGGSPYNCALALGRLKQDVGFLCPISEDAFGEMLLQKLHASNVVSLVADRSKANTALAVVSEDGRGRPAYSFYRQGTAERDLSIEKLKDSLPSKLEVFHIGGFAPIEADDAEIWLELASHARSFGAVLSIDPNVRPALVEDFAAYKNRISAFFDVCNVVKVSDEDLLALYGERTIDEHVKHIFQHESIELIVITLGEDGSRAFTRHHKASASIFAPPVFGDTVGAGDSLMAGILTSLSSKGSLSQGKLQNLDEAELADMLRFGAVTAGLNCGHVGCNPPTFEQVLQNL